MKSKWSRTIAPVTCTILVTATAVMAQYPDQWTKSPSSPVMPGFVGSTIIYHEGTYKMWGGFGTVSYATSSDGLTWTLNPASPVLEPDPDPNALDSGGVDNPSVVIVGGQYHMWYSGVDQSNDNRIFHATSIDGIAWVKDEANPVMDLGPPGSLDSSELIHPNVIYEPPLFRMWYNAVGSGDQIIAYAVSLDGVLWARDANPALGLGAPGEWDDAQLYMMNVVKYNGTYYMFYTGSGVSSPFGIGYATSADGTIWSKRSPSGAVLSPGSAGDWDDFAIGSPVVVFTDSEARMYYAGTRDFVDFSWGLATAAMGQPGNWLEIVCEQNPNNAVPYRIFMGANKVGASTCALTTNLGTYDFVQTGDAWYPEQQFLDDHADLDFAAMIARMSEGWTLIWDQGSGLTETTCTIDFGILDESGFPTMPIVMTPPNSLTMSGPTPGPPTIGWTFRGSVDPCLAVPDYMAVTLTGPGGQEYNSGDEMSCGTMSWTAPEALGAGDWTIEVANELSTVRDVPDGLLIEGDPWVLGNSNWLSFRTMGVPFFDVAGTEDTVEEVPAPRLVGIAPNPFNPHARIRFILPGRAAVSLHIYDIAGRVVRALVDRQVYGQGVHDLVWNGKDDMGRRVPSGSYFCRFTSEGTAQTSVMTLLK